MSYIIVTEQERHVFINRVNDRLMAGWKPCGGPFITHPIIIVCGDVLEIPSEMLPIKSEFNQAMIFEAEA